MFYADKPMENWEWWLDSAIPASQTEPLAPLVWKTVRPQRSDPNQQKKQPS